MNHLPRPKTSLRRAAQPFPAEPERSGTKGVTFSPVECGGRAADDLIEDLCGDEYAAFPEIMD